MAQQGADVADLDRLAADVQRHADELSALRGRLDRVVAATVWVGPDADRFRVGWRTTGGRAVTTISAALGDVARDLGREADQQRRASSATGTGGLGSSAGVPGAGRSESGSGVPAAGTPPDQVVRWWASLSPSEQAELSARSPERLGGLDGLPAAARDQANRQLLAEDLVRLRTEIDALAGSTRVADQDRRRALLDELANAQNVETYLQRAEGREDPLTGEPMVAQLYIYEPGAFHGDGRVAIAHGDLDTARHVAVSVPGVTNDVAGMRAGNADNLYDETRYASDESVAVLNWMGYDAPSIPGGDIVGAASRPMAIDGARHLTDDVAGLRSTWSGNDPPTHLTVVAHSYGSTTASWAAASMGMRPDDLVLIGSPGAGPAGDASDLSTGRGHTYVGSNSRDPVTLLGETGWIDPTSVVAAPGGAVELLGRDPAEDDFGAVRFQAERPGSGWNIDEHTSYLGRGTESLYNIAAIVGGDPDEVMVADHRDDPLADVDIGVDVDVRAHGDVDVGVGVQRGPFGVPLPDVDVDIDAGIEVDVDAHADVDVAMQDPETERTPTTGHTHDPHPGD